MYLKGILSTSLFTWIPKNNNIRVLVKLLQSLLVFVLAIQILVTKIVFADTIRNCLVFTITIICLHFS